MGSGLGMQSLVLGPDGVEERQSLLPRHELVVPLEQDRTGQLTAAASLTIGSSESRGPESPTTAAAICGPRAMSGIPKRAPIDRPQ